MTPTNFQSFADYLGLNEQSLRELEDSAMARAQESDVTASDALGRSYQQAQTEMAAGGAGSLSQQSSYLDYVRARREADSFRAGPATGMTDEEAAARGAMRMGRPGGPDFGGREQTFRDNLARDARGFAESRAAADAYRKRMQAEREAQDKAFAEAEDRMGPYWKDRQRYTQYSDAVAKSFQQANARRTRAGPGVRVISQEEYDTYGA